MTRERGYYRAPKPRDYYREAYACLKVLIRLSYKVRWSSGHELSHNWAAQKWNSLPEPARRAALATFAESLKPGKPVNCSSDMHLALCQIDVTAWTIVYIAELKRKREQ